METFFKKYKDARLLFRKRDSKASDLGLEMAHRCHIDLRSAAAHPKKIDIYHADKLGSFRNSNIPVIGMLFVCAILRARRRRGCSIGVCNYTHVQLHVYNCTYVYARVRIYVYVAYTC